MTPFDLPRGSVVILRDTAVVPAYADPSQAAGHDRIPGLFRQLAPYYRLAVFSRLPASIVGNVVGCDKADGTNQVIRLGHYGLEILWPDGRREVDPRISDAAERALEQLAAEVRERHAGALTRLGASVNTWPLCLAIDWPVTVDHVACVDIAADVKERARLKGLLWRETNHSLDVLPVYADEPAILSRLVRDLGAGGHQVGSLMYVHPQDGAQTWKMLRDLAETASFPPAINIEVAPPYREDRGIGVVVRGVAGEVTVGDPLRGIAEVVELLEQLVPPSARGPNA